MTFGEGGMCVAVLGLVGDILVSVPASGQQWGALSECVQGDVFLGISSSKLTPV